ncbi:HAD hydrolase, family IE [Teladorsagia circumcincta]|uniref:5'-nucleotidase n=1 Tax=Teladorsagia circumcincta TaxID=45464 RepID=A0A2G9UFZ6_TELCI|nr:HAD hydrolase, family IE [Teladorsagia circumcincta]
MNVNYETALSNCTTEEERAYVQTGWWNASHDIIVRSMVHRDDIPSLVRNSRLIWRKSMRQFLYLLEELSIPLLIFSAGIADIIEEAIRQLLGHIPSNVTIAANKMFFDEVGYVTAFTCPPVHSLSKTMAHLRDLIHGVDRMFSRRTNVVVIGDSESDAFMVDGWQEKKLLKIGLSEEEMPLLKAFDIVIASSDCIRLNDLVRYLTSPQQL